MNRLLPFLILFICSQGFAATYYAAASGGGGAASCVDSGANVCTLARAVVVASTGTNTIQCAAGTYAITTELTLDSGNTGANLTFTCATANGCTWGTTGTTVMVDIEPTMVSGTVTFDDINFNDDAADLTIRNQSPEVSLVIKNGTCTNSDSSSGSCVSLAEDTTNVIEQVTGADSTTSLRTGATTNVKIAQKITVGGSNITVNRATLFLTLINNIDGILYQDGETVTVTIETDSAGAPSGTPVTNGTSTSRLAYDIDPKGGWEEFDFSSNVTLTASTVYWIVLQGTYTASTTDYIKWSKDSTSGGYASGDGATYDGTNWTDETGVDYLFFIGRNHTRDVTIENMTFNVTRVCLGTTWVDDVVFDNSSCTGTGGSNIGLISISTNVEGGTAADSVEIKNSVFNESVSTNQLLTNSLDLEKNYINKVVIENCTGVVPTLLKVKTYIKKLFVHSNDLELTYTGNVPIQVGVEVDGVGTTQGVNDHPFEQIIFEDNYFYYSGTTHNHILLAGVGADNAVFRNNKIVANSGGVANAWGLVIKANSWFINSNSFYGVSPGVTLYGSNNSRVTSNTFVCFTNGSDGCLYIAAHQDAIYGGKHGIPFFNYVSDNIFYQETNIPAMEHGNTSVVVGRAAPYWSNRIDNNIYYAPSSTNQMEINAGASSELVTVAEGISVAQAAWQSSTYTDSTSISNYNDLNSYILDPGLADPANGNFRSSSSTVKNGGSVPNTSIGSYQSSGGRKWIGRGVS